jgi:cobalamin biosynthesis protein CobW
VTVDSVVAVVDGPALAEGRVAQDLAALAAQRAADPSLEHDDPVEEVFGDQVACADLIVLSKADLLDADARAAAEARVERHLGRAVKIVAGERGRVDPKVVLGQGLAVEELIDGRRTLHDGLADHDHDDFDSFVVELGAVTRPEELAARVAAAAEAADVLRVKGFAEVEDKPMRLVVQAVGPRVSHHFDRPWAAGEARGTRLVVIGLKGLDRDAVERILAA